MLTTLEYLQFYTERDHPQITYSFLWSIFQMAERLSGLESHCIVSLYSSELGMRWEHLSQQWELKKSQHSLVIPPPAPFLYFLGSQCETSIQEAQSSSD